MSNKYASITTEDFDSLLKSILDGMDTSTLLAFPGIYEILSEELNNEVLEAWEEMQPEQDDDAPCTACGSFEEHAPGCRFDPYTTD